MNAKLISFRNFAIVAVLAVVSVVAVVFAGRPRQTRVINEERLASALAQYTKDRQSRGEHLPQTIGLDTLVEAGYLHPEDTKPLEGVELTFHTDADDTHPNDLLVEARMPDGQMQAVLADGSVQQFSRSSWAEIHKNVGQQNVAANGSQPIRSETNRTSSAAGSRR